MSGNRRCQRGGFPTPTVPPRDIHKNVLAAIKYAQKQDLDFKEKAVLVAIASHAGDPEGRGMWPSVPTLAAVTSLRERSVYRALNQLKEWGFIEIDKGATWTRSNVYRFPDPFPDTESGSSEKPLTEVQVNRAEFTGGSNS